MNSSSLSNSTHYSTIPSIVTDSPKAIANITAPIIAANATVRVAYGGLGASFTPM